MIILNQELKFCRMLYQIITAFLWGSKEGRTCTFMRPFTIDLKASGTIFVIFS